MDIKSTKLIKGHELAKIMFYANFQDLGINLLIGNDGGSGKEEKKQRIEIPTQKIQMKYIVSQWYKYILIVYFF